MSYAPFEKIIELKSMIEGAIEQTQLHWLRNYLELLHSLNDMFWRAMWLVYPQQSLDHLHQLIDKDQKKIYEFDSAIFDLYKLVNSEEFFLSIDRTNYPQMVAIFHELTDKQLTQELRSLFYAYLKRYTSDPEDYHDYNIDDLKGIDKKFVAEVKPLLDEDILSDIFGKDIAECTNAHGYYIFLVKYYGIKAIRTLPISEQRRFSEFTVYMDPEIFDEPMIDYP